MFFPCRLYLPTGSGAGHLHLRSTEFWDRMVCEKMRHRRDGRETCSALPMRFLGEICVVAGSAIYVKQAECLYRPPGSAFRIHRPPQAGLKRRGPKPGCALFLDYIIDDVKDIIYILKFANLYYHTPTQNAIGFVIFLQNLQLKRRFFALSPHKCTCLARRGEKAGVSGSKKTEVFPSLPSARTKK